jgi:hypothetical protein
VIFPFIGKGLPECSRVPRRVYLYGSRTRASKRLGLGDRHWPQRALLCRTLTAIITWLTSILMRATDGRHRQVEADHC